MSNDTLKQTQIQQFNPNGIGLKNGNLYGLPFDQNSAEIIIIPVPFDVTVSYKSGTAQAPEAILQASPQLDLYDFDVLNAWKIGIYMLPVSKKWAYKSQQLRQQAELYINYVEENGDQNLPPNMQTIQDTINQNCLELKNTVKKHATEILQNNKIAAVLGGDHSTPLGLIEALCTQYANFGILQIDAHADLRPAYEGFEFSHASVMYNALKNPQITKLVSVGVRDICEQEVELIQQSNQRVVPFYEHYIQKNVRIQQKFTFEELCQKIVNELPDNVYISFDIDGLDPKLCQHTGTPVAGGLSMHEAFFLIRQVAEAGKRIIGFDLNEVAPNALNPTDEWNANVGARILYKLCNITGVTNGLAKLHN